MARACTASISITHEGILVATIFTLDITIGKGDEAHTRTISIDPDEIPMGVLEDLEEFASVGDWKGRRRVISELFGLTKDEFRQMTVGQFVQIANALPSAISQATDVPNASAPLSG